MSRLHKRNLCWNNVALILILCAFSVLCRPHTNSVMMVYLSHVSSAVFPATLSVQTTISASWSWSTLRKTSTTAAARKTTATDTGSLFFPPPLLLVALLQHHKPTLVGLELHPVNPPRLLPVLHKYNIIIVAVA